MSDAISAAYEALIQFLYRAPIGLVQTTLDGQITLINPMSAQLLMPLVPHGKLLNLFDVLASVAPQLREMAAARNDLGAVICEGLRVPLPAAGLRGQPPLTLSIDLLRLDESTLMASFSDVTLVVLQEQQRLATRLRYATRIDSLTLMPNRAVVMACS